MDDLDTDGMGGEAPKKLFLATLDSLLNMEQSNRDVMEEQLKSVVDGVALDGYAIFGVALSSKPGEISSVAITPRTYIQFHVEQVLKRARESA